MSPDTQIDKGNPLQPALGMPATYVCNKCDHRGYNFPEIELEELKRAKKD
jgi:hypothetical protein